MSSLGRPDALPFSLPRFARVFPLRHLFARLIPSRKRLLQADLWVSPKRNPGCLLSQVNLKCQLFTPVVAMYSVSPSESARV